MTSRASTPASAGSVVVDGEWWVVVASEGSPSVEPRDGPAPPGLPGERSIGADGRNYLLVRVDDAIDDVSVSVDGNGSTLTRPQR